MAVLRKTFVWKQRVKRIFAKAGAKWQKHFADNRGMGTVEIILIIVVLVGLVIIFKSQITAIVNSLFNKITTQTSEL